MKGVFWILVLLLVGCATQPSPRPGSEAALCLDAFTTFDAAVEEAMVRDQGAPQVPGFPYLRINRFLASFTGEIDSAARFEAWVERLARLDREARHHELANLPLQKQAALKALSPGEELHTALEQCRNTLLALELATPTSQQQLRTAARVPDDYVTGWRVMGLYPLSGLFVAAGVRGWHREVRENFALPLAELPMAGSAVAWLPPQGERLTTAEVAALLRSSADNPLGLPEPGDREQTLLFASFAPQWLIDTADENDRPGTPVWGGDNTDLPGIDTSQPTLYRRLSYTRFNGRVLLQLNYIIWFKARPPQDGVDIYAGRLDGINFRVTLGPDGRPLLYDTIHNCGCYHKFFPVAPLQLRPEAASLPEPPMVPQILARAGGTPLIHVASRTHFIRRLEFTPLPEGKHYRWDDYQQLRSLPLADGSHRSLFGGEGIVPGSERSERFLLWPMGVRSPGAMRQWGRHPTAFLGRRHFDEPFLIEKLFEPDSSGRTK
ncbi:MAG: hypothetical protein ABFS08_11615 [Pseudomonadota bacterium]